MDLDYQKKDNRPLKFEEFEALQNHVIYVSIPADYELGLWKELYQNNN